jgi:hypothetical protein
VRPALLLSLAAAGCDQNLPPPTPDLPQVTLNLTEPSTVATSLKFTVSVSGCDQVKSLTIHDREEQLKAVTYTTHPTPVELAMNEVRYTRGIAANLSLSARVTCSDGRTNTSQAQAAKFFPVAEVIEPPTADTQVVTDYFVAEGSGTGAAFIGCTQDATGRSRLYRVTRANPQNAQSVDMPLPCTLATTITERTATGQRWVWTPDSGAFLLDSNLNITALVRQAGLEQLFVAPDGDALIYTPVGFQRLSRTTGNYVWPKVPTTDFLPLLIATPVFRNANTVAIPVKRVSSGDPSDIMVAVLDWTQGTWTSFHLIDSYMSIPPVALDPAGTALYVTTYLPNGAGAYVRKCATDGTVDEGRCLNSANRLWTSVDLEGAMALLLPVSGGSRLAAIGAGHLWFLDAATGRVLNKDTKALSPEGSLVARIVLPAPNNVFYQFNSAHPTDSQPLPPPQEILATDGPEKGELYRYQVPGNSLSGALDDTGTLWLRIGRKLVRTLSPGQYRQVR